MGQAKIKQREGYSTKLIEEWEADDCVNFAVALARLTGWLLHVDWWAPSADENIRESEMTPLRVYVADNREGIFDVRGVRTLVDFNEGIIIKRAKKLEVGYGGVRTRFYSEAKLSTLPLRSLPDESKIALATEAIKENPAYLNSIPAKSEAGIPAYDAARYTFGKCAVYAEAMRELVGLQPVAILVKKFAPLYKGTPRYDDGYIHSIVLHENGMGEDAWGIVPVADIAERFGAVEFEVSPQAHQQVVANYLRTSSDIYQVELEIARGLISRHRLDIKQ